MESLADPIPMGGHFTSMFREGEDLTWRLVPYILVWGAFGLVFLVSRRPYFVPPSVHQA